MWVGCLEGLFFSGDTLKSDLTFKKLLILSFSKTELISTLDLSLLLPSCVVVGLLLEIEEEGGIGAIIGSIKSGRSS